MDKTIEDNLLLSTPLVAAKNILKSPFGIHCLIVYSNLNKCREFYSYYVQEIMKNNTQIIEIAPFYETEDSVRSSLININHKKTIEVDKIEDKEAY